MLDLQASNTTNRTIKFQSLTLTATSPYADTVSSRSDTDVNDAHSSANAIPQTNTIQQIRRILELPVDIDLYVTNHLGSVAITCLSKTDSNLGASPNRNSLADASGAR